MKLNRLILILIAFFAWTENATADTDWFTVSGESEFSQWLEIYFYSPDHSYLEKIAVERINRLASTPQELFIAYLQTDPENFSEANKQLEEKLISEMEKMDLEKIDLIALASLLEIMDVANPNLERVVKIAEKKAKTFKDWYHLYIKISENHPLEKKALDNLQELAVDFESWRFIFENINPEYSLENDLLKVKAFKKSVELATTFEDWDFIFNNSESGSEIEKQSVKNMLKLAKTAENWLMIYKYQFFDPENEVQKEILNQILKLASSFEDWFGVFTLNKEDTMLQYEALERMTDKVSTYQEAYALYVISPSNSSPETKALEVLEQTASCIDEWVEIYKTIPNHFSLKDKAYQKIEELASGFEAWLHIYKELEDEDKLKKLAIKKMEETANKTSHWVKLLRELPEDSPLHKKAKKTVEGMMANFH